MSRVYVAGPMTGYVEYNFPAFNAAATELRAAGHAVVNPADNGVQDGWAWVDYLRCDLHALLECDTLYALRGWKHSRGANLEMYVARALGMNIVHQEDRLMTHRKTPRLPNLLLGLLLVLCAVADWRQGGIAWRALAGMTFILSAGPFTAAAERS